MNYSNALITLLQLPGIGRRTALSVVSDSSCITSKTNKMQDIIQNSKQMRFTGLTQGDIAKAESKALRILEESDKQRITCLDYFNTEYPLMLRLSADPPAVLYIKGDPSFLQNNLNTIAIVGSRQASEHSLRIAHQSGRLSAEKGFVVVSGLAMGCDTEAHRGALDGFGKTIAVLPSGLDSIVPKSNKYLAERILESGGCLVSEYPVGTQMLNSNYIERNRIQSALSKGIVVVETSNAGGTMQTAKFGKADGRSVACFVPLANSMVKEKALGNQRLLREGAYPLENMEDVEAFLDKMISTKIEESARNKKINEDEQLGMDLKR